MQILTEMAENSQISITHSEPEVEGDDVYVFPCSESQRICWYLEQLAPGSPVNNIAVRFSLKGDLQIPLLERAFSEVITRHEILRTTFIYTAGAPRQVVHLAQPFELQVVNLDASTEPELSQASEQLSLEEARVGFDLQSGPLLRAKLLRRSPHDHVLLVTMHHIVSDGWSVGVLAEEVGALYEALFEDKAPDLPNLPVQYADYACWQEQWLDSAEHKQQLENWKEELDGFQPLRLTTDFERPASSSNRGEIRSLLLNRSLTDALKSLSDQQGCTLFMTMLSAFNVLMFSESGQSDLVIRTQTAGRNKVELEPLIGWFVNSIPFRNQIDGDAPFVNLLRNVQRTVVKALERQATPFEKLLETIKPQWGGDRQPPFQVNFIFQRDFVKPWSRGGVEMTPIPSKSAGTFVDLNFFLVERKDGWRLSVDVNTDVFRPETGERLIQRLRSILEEAAAAPDSSIQSLLKRTGGQPVTRLQRIPQTASLKSTKSSSLASNTDIEQQLLQIWREVLATDQIEPQTNFFDVGGHSLLAVQMLTRVQGIFGTKLQLADLFREPTICAMAEVLSSSSLSRRQGEIIAVQPKGSSTPFFMVGGDHWFRPLARHIGEDQPFLGVGFRQNGEYPRNVDFLQLAERVAATIREAQPEGPYRVGGWCVDGALAFEAACVLERQGAKVAVVILFDVINPAYRREYRRRRQALQRAILRTFQMGKQVASTGKYRMLFSEIRDLTHRAIQKLSGFSPSRVLDDLEHADAERQHFRRRLYQAEEKYTPGFISAPMVLLRTKLDGFQSADLGWGGVSSSGLQIVELPADHTSMFYESEVMPLALEVRTLLKQAIEQ